MSFTKDVFFKLLSLSHRLIEVKSKSFIINNHEKSLHLLILLCREGTLIKEGRQNKHVSPFDNLSLYDTDTDI